MHLLSLHCYILEKLLFQLSVHFCLNIQLYTRYPIECEQRYLAYKIFSCISRWRLKPVRVLIKGTFDINVLFQFTTTWLSSRKGEGVQHFTPRRFTPRYKSDSWFKICQASRVIRNSK